MQKLRPTDTLTLHVDINPKSGDDLDWIIDTDTFYSCGLDDHTIIDEERAIPDIFYFGQDVLEAYEEPDEDHTPALNQLRAYVERNMDQIVFRTNLTMLFFYYFLSTKPSEIPVELQVFYPTLKGDEQLSGENLGPAAANASKDIGNYSDATWIAILLFNQDMQVKKAMKMMNHSSAKLDHIREERRQAARDGTLNTHENVQLWEEQIPALTQGVESIVRPLVYCLALESDAYSAHEIEKLIRKRIRRFSYIIDDPLDDFHIEDDGLHGSWIPGDEAISLCSSTIPFTAKASYPIERRMHPSLRHETLHGIAARSARVTWHFKSPEEMDRFIRLKRRLELRPISSIATLQFLMGKQYEYEINFHRNGLRSDMRHRWFNEALVEDLAGVKAQVHIERAQANGNIGHEEIDWLSRADVVSANASYFIERQVMYEIFDSAPHLRSMAVNALIESIEEGESSGHEHFDQLIMAVNEWGGEGILNAIHDFFELNASDQYVQELCQLIIHYCPAYGEESLVRQVENHTRVIQEKLGEKKLAASK